MSRPRSKPRPRSTAIWLGIVALVLQAFGAAIHASSHHDHDVHGPLSIASRSAESDSGTHQTHAHDHTHCHAHDAHTEDEEPSDPQRHTSHPGEPASPHDHDDCPTCVKILANARTAFTSAPDLLTLARVCRAPFKLGAERLGAITMLRVQPARGPPSRSPTIA